VKHEPESGVARTAQAGLPGFLATMPPQAAARLLDGALQIDVPAGATVYREEERPRAILVREGLLRVYLRSPDGRQVTIRYARTGDVVGLALVLGGPGPITIESLTGSSLIALRIDDLRAMVANDAAVARACAEELARQLFNAFDEIANQAFLSVRQRVARQLLDLAVHADDGTLVARVSQQELGDAIASAREVVSRALHELREAGLVASSREGIVISDPLGLNEEASGLAPRRNEDAPA
jgi:CRP/FNR family cyclic AMP-dependent transcriptional regulator